MKRKLKYVLSVLFVGLIMSFTPTNHLHAQGGVSVSFQLFYDELSPHGQWIMDPNYGYVWAPRVSRDFMPYYTNGRWAMTEYGNTWVSDYAWGWAPFHYGRWVYDSFYGWVWIPGDTWGPAWVTWRSGGGFYGWAPLGPGMNIHVGFGNYYIPDAWWVFIPSRYIYNPYYYSYWNRQYNTNYIQSTTIINNYYNDQYAYGPRRNDISRHTGEQVKIYDLRNENRPGRTQLRENAVSLYRPTISRPTTDRNNAAPQRVVKAERPIENPTRAISRPSTSETGATFRPAHETQRESAIRPNRQIQTEERVERERVTTQRSSKIEHRSETQPNRAIRAQKVNRRQMVQEQRGTQRIATPPAQTERFQEHRSNRRAEQQTQQLQMQRQRAEKEHEIRRVQQQQARRAEAQRLQMQQQRAEKEHEIQRVQQQQARRAEAQRYQREHQRPSYSQPTHQQPRTLSRPQRQWKRPEPGVHRPTAPQKHSPDINRVERRR